MHIDSDFHVVFFCKSLIHGDSGVGKTQLAETLRSNVEEDDGCKLALNIVLYSYIDFQFANVHLHVSCARLTLDIVLDRFYKRKV